MRLEATHSEHFDSAKLAALQTWLNADYIATQKLAGYSFLIAHRGAIAALAYGGQSAIGAEAAGAFPIGEDSLFRIYSMTKPVTSLMLLMLAEQGKCALHDPLKKYIPAFANPQIWVSGDTSDHTTRPAERDITLHDLLTHQSGLTYDFLNEHPLDALYRRKNLTASRKQWSSLAAFCDALAAMPLLFTPGTAWNYSCAIDVVGHVIEIITGANLETASREMLFTPLGMDDTAYHIAPEKAARLTHCYYHDPKEKHLRCVDAPENSYFAAARDFCGGGAGLISSLPDYYRFCQMLRNKGTLDGVQLITPDTQAAMFTNQLNHDGGLVGYSASAFSESGLGGHGFGIGGALVLEPEKTNHASALGNFSWSGMAGTWFWLDPTHDLTVIFMTQLVPFDSYPLRENFAARLYDALNM